MTNVKFTKLDEVWATVECTNQVAFEIAQHFTYDIPGAQYDRRYKRGYWDGKLKLFDYTNRRIHLGLWYRLVEYCMEHGHTFEYTNQDIIASVPPPDFIDSLQTGREARPYQREIFNRGVELNRGLFLSPTGSGKSLSLYYLAQYYKKKTLLIVPRKSLVKQMRGDFIEYGWDMFDIHEIMEGSEKNTDKSLVISTYQSIYKQPRKWFAQFEVVIGDEAHLFQAKTLTSLMNKMNTTKYRFGFTGTLNGQITMERTLEGLFGPLYQAAKTVDLIDDGYLANLRIRCVVLKHKPDRASVKTYQDEIEYLMSSEARNRFLRNLVTDLEGNTLMLFERVEKHGKILEAMVRDIITDRPVYFVHGGIDTEVREQIREEIAQSDRAVYIASYGTLSTGVNIPKLHNLVFAHPSKGRIRNLQSIGRVLRLHETKDTATLYDIADDFGFGTKMNYTLNHFVERVKIYNSEGFDYKVYSVELD